MVRVKPMWNVTSRIAIETDMIALDMSIMYSLLCVISFKFHPFISLLLLGDIHHTDMFLCYKNVIFLCVYLHECAHVLVHTRVCVMILTTIILI